MKKNIREDILNILEQIESESGYSNIVLNKKTKNMEVRDSNFTRELVYGVIENKIYFEWIVSQFSNVKLSKISPKVLIIIKMGIYQILNMDKVPDSAAVNESVKLSKKYSNRGAQGFVNGILRNIVRNKGNIGFPDRERDMVKYLSVRYSYPEWIIEDWIRNYGESFVEELCIANAKKVDLNIRVNTLKISRAELMERLEQSGRRCRETEYGKDTLEVMNPDGIIDTEEYRDGLFTVQDESSSLVAQVMDPKEGSTVVDVCSAPGGKTTHMGQLMKNSGRIIARDVHDHKLKLVESNASRLGIDIIEVSKGDGTVLDKNLVGVADYCLVDAPCSGLGLIRKKPEIKYNKKRDDLIELSKIQKQILGVSSNYVKKGGVLVYSTCTLNENENIEVVKDFLKYNPEFRLMGFEVELGLEESKRGYVELYPHIHGTDGFFISKMIRI